MSSSTSSPWRYPAQRLDENPGILANALSPSQQTIDTLFNTLEAASLGAGLGPLAVSTSFVAGSALATITLGAAAGASAVLAYTATKTTCDRFLASAWLRQYISSESPYRTMLKTAAIVLSLLVGVGAAVGVILLLATALATPAGMAIVGAVWLLILLYLGYSSYTASTR